MKARVGKEARLANNMGIIELEEVAQRQAQSTWLQWMKVDIVNPFHGLTR